MNKEMIFSGPVINLMLFNSPNLIFWVKSNFKMCWDSLGILKLMREHFKTTTELSNIFFFHSQSQICRRINLNLSQIADSAIRPIPWRLHLCRLSRDRNQTCSNLDNYDIGKSVAAKFTILVKKKQQNIYSSLISPLKYPHWNPVLSVFGPKAH